MAERVTMKTIAGRVGVSVNTVHKALTGKPGVSEQMRERIVRCAEGLGYRRNANASNLRRQDLVVAVLLPSPEGEGHYYFRYLWEGIERYPREADNAVVLDCRPYPTGAYARALEELAEEISQGRKVDGMVAYAPSDARSLELLSGLGREGVPTELLDGDVDLPNNIGCMVADYASAGQLMAEQALNMLPSEPQDILLLSGDRQMSSHAKVWEAFLSTMAEHAPAHQIREIFGAHSEVDVLRKETKSALLSDPHPALACSVFAVGTEVLCQALRESGLAGKVPAIGNDLFPESVEALKAGVLRNVVFKDPAGRAREAIETLCSYLLWGQRSSERAVVGDVDMVFRSNLAQYCRHVGIPYS
ncbi:LacI family DNA-binding transcriptional regulator [Olsenella sp. Marseille-P4559]|uniref:substrate-binding domain-containing protein n=1 Tax=Olsenella sp. Marseille-P4559 TaxID=2364795 RepID=UPI0010305890|nr:LacI family DNA-binding transcriptional regulator [Olsenella sp. Marseille-P4559]